MGKALGNSGRAFGGRCFRHWVVVGGVGTCQDQLLGCMRLTGAFDIQVSILDTCDGAWKSIAELHFIPVHLFWINFASFGIFHLIDHYFWAVAFYWFAQLLQKGQILEYFIVVVVVAGEAPIMAAIYDGLRIHCLEENAPSYRRLSLLTLRCGWSHTQAAGEECRRRMLPGYSLLHLTINNGGDKCRWVGVNKWLRDHWVTC